MPLVAGHYPPKNPQWLLQGRPSLRRSNLDLHGGRLACTSDLAALTTQVMLSAAIALQAGDVVTSISFMSGATAANLPLNWWFALYDNADTPAKLAQTADQTTAAWAADTVKTVALATPQLITVSDVYYAAIMVKATACPTLAGVTLARAALSTGMFSSDKVVAETSGAALTTTAPATIATPTPVVTVPWVAVT